MAKSAYVPAETGRRRGHTSYSLTCVPTPSLSALPIRRLTLRDHSACADLSEDRGWPREEHKWGLLLTAGTGYGIDDPEGGLVAACVVTEYGLQDRPDLGAIGMVLVAERHARQGVGRRLMRHIVSVMGTTPLTLHATPNGRRLNRRPVRPHPDGTARIDPATAGHRTSASRRSAPRTHNPACPPAAIARCRGGGPGGD
ncbi:hypothetical protein SALBM311S_12690 [Streptomyces alboniger]